MRSKIPLARALALTGASLICFSGGANAQQLAAAGVPEQVTITGRLEEDLPTSRRIGLARWHGPRGGNPERRLYRHRAVAPDSCLRPFHCTPKWPVRLGRHLVPGGDIAVFDIGARVFLDMERRHRIDGNLQNVFEGICDSFDAGSPMSLETPISCPISACRASCRSTTPTISFDDALRWAGGCAARP